MMPGYFYTDSYLHNPRLDITDPDKKEKITTLVKPFQLSIDDCLKLKEVFNKEMELGLSPSSEDRKSTCLLMENTFMCRLPTGREEGLFLSLDLGSTNFRVILSRLHGDNHLNDFSVKYYDVGPHLRKGSSVPLFDYMAECIEDFFSSNPELKEKGRIPLGFSFSYPMRNEAVDEGILVTWTKSYDLPDAVGKNAVQLLRDAIAKRGVTVDVVAILNDSTGTLIKGHYLDNDCMIGMIFGSGFNCCYVDAVERIHKLTDKQRNTLKGFDEVGIDIECGGFGDNGCINWAKTDIDKELDRESLFPHSYSFEKMFAGNFIGDIVRRALVKLAERQLLLNGVLSKELMTKDSLKAADLVEMERVGQEAIRKIFTRLGYNDVSNDDVNIIAYTARVVVVRAAVLSSTLLSTLIDRIDRDRTVIAIDGSFYTHHPLIHKLMVDVIKVLSPDRKFDIIEAKDGSGMGAGLAAACCVRQ